MSVGLTGEQVEALAEMFADPLSARQVVANAGVRAPDVPWGAQSSRVFWRAVADLLEHGIASGGAARLLAEAAELFPENPVFAATGPAPEPLFAAGQAEPVSSPPRRSAYVEQVRQIAPPRLVGRAGELARLAEFCTAHDDAAGGRYVWWRAAAWTGKSALMSSFVLAPPPGVRVVSFFITARYAGNSDRAAFVEIVTEQLADIVGESVPPFQNPGRAERLWFKFFADAAAHCRAHGQRLVLVVDGLDEDRGVTGPGARSIAGLLPANPPHGARVVVAGRPDPPIPDDVPAGHPLSDRNIVQVLERSEVAATIRADMRSDLERLRTGSPWERDLLGLMTAAGGGLSGRDLAELTGDLDVTEWDVERLLSTVAGRSFSSRAARWDPAGRSRVYLLGHEELAQESARAYGSRRLAAYREQLHAWAYGYRRQQWPRQTPEYLLRGYYRLLLETGELTRAVDCATDQPRHDRMLDLTGGDTAALAEITDAQNSILTQPSPDLRLMARLAVHRQRIADRNRNIPTNLPGVWARLGHSARAEQLARATTTPYFRDQALVEVVGALAQTGEHAHAEQIARTIPEPHSQAKALVEVAAGLIQAGECDRAEQVTRDVTNPDIQAGALAGVAGALARAGEQARARQLAAAAEQVALSTTDPYSQVRALADVAGALVQTGEQARARQVAALAEQVAREITQPSIQAWALGAAAGALARAGEPARAEQVARDITEARYQAPALVGVVRALAQVGEYARAEQIAHRITDPGSQAQALAEAAGSLAWAGEQARAEQVAAVAEQVARDITNPDAQAWALADVAGALAQAGEHARAEEVAAGITDPASHARALADVAGALARAGEHDARAEQLAAVAEQVARDITYPHIRVRALAGVADALARSGERAQAGQVAAVAEQVARASTDPDAQAWVLVEVAGAYATAGEYGHAEQVAHGITDPSRQAQALAKVAGALARSGEGARAGQVAAVAEQVARASTDPDSQAWALVSVAVALARAGEPARAEQVAAGITDPGSQAGALAEVASALARAGERARAEQVATVAEKIARAITDPLHQAWALVGVAEALARAGEHARAEQVAADITDPNSQARAQAEAGLAGAFAQAGEHARAEQVARDITYPELQAQALVAVAGTLAQAGEHARAEQLVRDITDPDSQARALADVAGALAQAGDLRWAGRLLGEALSLGDWTCLPLGVIADVSPAVIRTIAAATVGNGET
ncbi:hypothetical protein I6A60_27420 [Frankia sp. AgB1.9]|uniref:effector-associated domain EAD1-containing protein n=1 Tax=unclassified Frankia TaxID=2632575 RepID=UPI00193296EF|nr:MULTISPECIES: effector-associated domain EAD1-containing protein [unclassified Frankia]MBL7491138.1 hypothetical protein [Frankia sp. AgW1.1]MBL7551559.1 hypothetical protein [Frankia sp. AgB1.9]MBL7621794.1 hypothetical protein [Frankia sp. AgB1.8]